MTETPYGQTSTSAEPPPSVDADTAHPLTKADTPPPADAPTTGETDVDEALSHFDAALEDESDAGAHIEAGTHLLSHLQRRLDDIGGR